MEDFGVLHAFLLICARLSNLISTFQQEKIKEAIIYEIFLFLIVLLAQSNSEIYIIKWAIDNCCREYGSMVETLSFWTSNLTWNFHIKFGKEMYLQFWLYAE